jgi:hypothetical protein
MPEEIEVPTEHLHEHMEHSAEHSKENWIMGVALSSAILAVFAAISALLAGSHANEAMINQIKASDQWAYYQAKGIKASLLTSKIEILTALKRSPSGDDVKKAEQYKDDQEKIKEEATKFEEDSEAHLKHHEILAHSVTFFQVAIAIGAIAALARKRVFWLFSMAVGALGVVFFVMGIIL